MSDSRVMLDRRYTFSAISLEMLSMGVTIPYTVIPGYDPGSLSKMGNQYIRIRKTSYLWAHYFYSLYFLGNADLIYIFFFASFELRL